MGAGARHVDVGGVDGGPNEPGDEECMIVEPEGNRLCVLRIDQERHG